MPKTKQRRKSKDSTADLIRNLMIVQMGLAGVGQRGIREIVGGSINDVNRIVKHLKKSKRAPSGRG
jgi:transposase-like protein